MIARSRRTDPATSHEVANDVEKSGKAEIHREICLSVVSRREGLTAAEIAQIADLERHVPSRRLPELRSKGIVENREVRVCKIMGTKAMTWYMASPKEVKQEELFR